MKTTRLKEEFKEEIKGDAVLCGKICQALGKSTSTVLYRMLPNDDERLTFPRIQSIIHEHLQIPAATVPIEQEAEPIIKRKVNVK